jgi:hypothetical protein
MQNVVVHIVLPKNLRLKNGQILGSETTFSVASELSPFYCSIEQVKLAGGTYLSKLSDFTVASMVYEVSKDADSYSYNEPAYPGTSDPKSPQFKKWRLWINARQNWVTAITAKVLLQNVWDLAGTRGSKTLGNFSINRVALLADEGFPKKVTDLQSEAAQWLIAIKSGGEVGPGGHIRGIIAAKGKWDADSAPPGRLWVTTGMGANQKSFPGYGSSNGKPLKYSSAPLTMWRYGRLTGSYVAVIGRVPF